MQHRRMVVAAVVLLASLIISACGSSDTARQTTHHAAQTPQATASWEKTTEKSPSPAPTLPPTAAPTATPTPTAEPTPTPPPAPVQFAVIGDYGMAGLMAEDVSSLVKSWQPDFIVTTGDNNYPSGGADTIDINVGQYYHEYIYPYDGGYGEALVEEEEEEQPVNRFFPVPGNHDLMTDNGQPYYDYFTLPGNERTYHVSRGLVDLFMLNSMPGEPEGVDADSSQANWLREQLAASGACWKLVVFHHPPYTSDSRGPYEWMRWPFAEWGADAALAGHHHVYERLVLDGFPYFVNGLGGGSRYAIKEIAEGSEVQYNADHGAMLVEATGSQITFQFITRLDEVIDTYTLEKTCF